MANFRAINAACEAVVRLLRLSWQPGLFNNSSLNFEVYQTRNFDQPMTNGVSLYLYHVSINAVQRTLPVPQNPVNGRQRHPQLPLDLHFMLTPWGQDASMEQQILGWVMRVLEDNPKLPPGLLNAAGGAAFEENEIVEIVAGQMTNEEMFRIWEVLPGDYRVSVPYVARVVRIDSLIEAGGGVVLTRDLRFGKEETP
jgi:hypothetical protein